MYNVCVLSIRTVLYAYYMYTVYCTCIGAVYVYCMYMYMYSVYHWVYCIYTVGTVYVYIGTAYVCILYMYVFCASLGMLCMHTIYSMYCIVHAGCYTLHVYSAVYKFIHARNPGVYLIYVFLYMRY